MKRLATLAGIAAALRHASALDLQSVLTIPSDAPFLPLDLAERLASGLETTAIACAETRAGLEPLFALWRVATLPVVEAAVAAGRLAVRGAMADAGFSVIRFDDERVFTNLNTPEDYDRALTWEIGD